MIPNTHFPTSFMILDQFIVLKPVLVPIEMILNDMVFCLWLTDCTRPQNQTQTKMIRGASVDRQNEHRIATFNEVSHVFLGDWMVNNYWIYLKISYNNIIYLAEYFPTSSSKALYMIKKDKISLKMCCHLKIRDINEL